VERGFHLACADLKPAQRFVVHPGTERYPLGEGVEAISLTDLTQTLQSLKPGESQVIAR
jgi:hypothetical protein